MLSTACYESRAYEKDAWPSASTLAWPILDAERFSDLSFDLLVQAGMKMGLTQKRARPVGCDAGRYPERGQGTAGSDRIRGCSTEAGAGDRKSTRLNSSH